MLGRGGVGRPRLDSSPPAFPRKLGREAGHLGPRLWVLPARHEAVAQLKLVRHLDRHAMLSPFALPPRAALSEAEQLRVTPKHLGILRMKGRPRFFLAFASSE